MAESEINDGVIAYTEEEAARPLHMKSERALAEYRRERLRIGDHYSKIGRTVLYTPEQLRAILLMDKRKAA